VNRPGAFAEYISVPMTNVWHHDHGIDRDVASIFDPFGNAVHTALSFPVLGEDVLITGAGPIGIMAAAVVKHAGARYIVVTDVNDYRLDLAKRMGATLAVNVKHTSLRDVQKKLGMKEGFDVGLEMSGNPAAFRDMIDNMCHGGKIAISGHSAEGNRHRLEQSHFQHAHAQRHLRPRDVRDMVQNDGDVGEWTEHQTGHHAHVSLL
jgi:threonine 3-dehydrogenase